MPNTRTTLLAIGLLASLSVAFSTAISSEGKPPTALEAKTPSLLINAKRLAALQQEAESKVRVVDTRSAQEFAGGHIPNAVRVDVPAWAKDLKNKLRREDKKLWTERLAKLGIAPDAHVVVIGSNTIEVARLWWCFKYLGVQNVSVVDGGWAAWTADKDRPVTDEAAKTVEAKNAKVKFQRDRLALIEQVRTHTKKNDAALLDARSEREFRAGRIPGAANSEWKEVLREDGTYRPAAELRKHFAKSKIDLDKKVIAYCQSGRRSSVEVFALELAGYRKVSNYIGSWGEWSQADDAPVEK